MAYDPKLQTPRDRLRAVLGDIEDPPGFAHLSTVGDPIIPTLTEAHYDGLIAAFGLQKAGERICDMVIGRMTRLYEDGDVREDLTNIIELYQSIKADLRSGQIVVDGLSGSAPMPAVLNTLSTPDLEVFRTL